MRNAAVMLTLLICFHDLHRKICQNPSLKFKQKEKNIIRYSKKKKWERVKLVLSMSDQINYLASSLVAFDFFLLTFNGFEINSFKSSLKTLSDLTTDSSNGEEVNLTKPFLVKATVT